LRSRRARIRRVEGAEENEEGSHERGLDANRDVILTVDPSHYRPTEVDSLLGDSSKAKRELVWQLRVTFRDLMKEMAEEDLKIAERDAMVRKHGYSVFNSHEL
jgi:GDPmannose 4,6-dehydratase